MLKRKSAPKLPKPSAAETAILNVLWDTQPCSVRDIHAALSQTKTVGYTTTLKQVQRMFDKGFVSRVKGAGKSFDYSAAVERDATKASLVGRFVKTTFSGSVPDLVMHALGTDQADPDDITRIRALLDDLEANTQTDTKTER